MCQWNRWEPFTFSNRWFLSYYDFELQHCLSRLAWDSSSYFVGNIYWRVDITSTQDSCPLFLTVLLTATLPRIPSNMQTSSERKLWDYATLELQRKKVSLANMLNYQIRTRHAWERRVNVNRNTCPEYWVRKWTMAFLVKFTSECPELQRVANYLWFAKTRWNTSTMAQWLWCLRW